MADPTTPVQNKFFKTTVNGIDSYQVIAPKDAGNEAQLVQQGFTPVTQAQYIAGQNAEIARLGSLNTNYQKQYGMSLSGAALTDINNSIAKINAELTKYKDIPSDSMTAGDSGMVIDSTGRFTDPKTLANEKDPAFLTPAQFQANNAKLAGMTQKQIYDQSAAANPALAAANPYQAPGTTGQRVDPATGMILVGPTVDDLYKNTEASIKQQNQYHTPEELKAMMNYKIPGIADAVTSPEKVANAAFINAIFKEQFGRDATAAELAKFGAMTVKDAANIVLRERSPFLPVGQAFAGTVPGKTQDFKADIPSTFGAKTVSAAFDGTTPSGTDIANTLGLHASNNATGMDLEIQNVLDRQAELRSKFMSALTPNSTEQELQKALVDVHKQITDTDLSAQAGINKIMSQAIPMEPLIGQGAVLQRQANLTLQTLQGQEKNLTERLGLAQNNRKTQLAGLQGLLEYAGQDLNTAFKMKDAILANEDRAFAKAQTLQENARQNLAAILTQFKGLDNEDLSAESQAQLATLSAKVGIPFGVLTEGMKVVKDQILYDKNLKAKEQASKQAADAFDQQYKVEMLRNAQQNFELDAQKLKIDLLKAQQGDPTQQMNAELKLRTDFGNEPIVIKYESLANSYQQMQAALGEANRKGSAGGSQAAADQAMITLFNKLLDPTSVVREGEYSRTTQGQALLNQAQGYYDKLVQGGAGLTTSDRQAIVDTAGKLIGAAKDVYLNKADEYQYLADKYGLDPTAVLGSAASNYSEKKNDGIGSLSQKFESGGDPGAIGYDNTGGYSYGTYQLAHGSAKTFIEQTPYSPYFKGLSPDSKAFQDKWKQIAQMDPEGFKSLQHDYIERTHYEPQVKKLDGIGIDINDLSPVMKDVIWSTAVQHGPNTNIVANVFKRLGPDAPESKIITQIYRDRWSGGQQFARSTPDVQKSVYNRFFGANGELNQALNQLV